MFQGRKEGGTSIQITKDGERKTLAHTSLPAVAQLLGDINFQHNALSENLHLVKHVVLGIIRVNQFFWLIEMHIEGRVMELHPQTEHLDINLYSQFWHWQCGSSGLLFTLLHGECNHDLPISGLEISKCN